jgi:hypothetical protein
MSQMGLTCQVTNCDQSIRETGKGVGAKKMVYVTNQGPVIVQKPNPTYWEDGGNLTRETA